MKVNLFIIVSVIIIYSFSSSNLHFADDIKINKKVSEKNYRIHELKNHFLKIEGKKNPVIHIKNETGGMSKVSAALLGGGIGFTVGGTVGGFLGSTMSSNGSLESSNVVEGILIGGLPGLVIGGAIGYLLGD